MNRFRAAIPAVLAAALAAGACASDDSENLGVEVYLHNAQGYMEGGHYDQALVQYQRALEIDPESRKAKLGEIGCLYQLGLGDAPAAGRAIQSAQEKAALLDVEAYGDNGWKVRLLRGQIHARLADLWQRKVALAKRKAEAGEAGADAEGAESEAKRAREDAAARREFLAVLATPDQKFAKDNLTALFYLASRSALEADSPEDYDEALGYFRRYEKVVEDSKALWTAMKKQEPENEAVYDGKLRNAVAEEVQLRDLKAVIHFKRREHEESIAELDRILALDPYRASSFLTRAQNHEEMGRFGAAADDYRRFLKLTDLPASAAAVIEASERMAKCEEKVREKLGE